MVWMVWFLVLGWLIWASLGAWRAYLIRRHWEHAVCKHQSRMSIAGDEFVGFLANPDAGQRGGMAIRASRPKARRGLMEKTAQAEANRFLRAEIAGKAVTPESPKTVQE
jgi:hypothetical protein